MLELLKLRYANVFAAGFCTYASGLCLVTGHPFWGLVDGCIVALNVYLVLTRPR